MSVDGEEEEAGARLLRALEVMERFLGLTSRAIEVRRILKKYVGLGRVEDIDK